MKYCIKPLRQYKIKIGYQTLEYGHAYVTVNAENHDQAVTKLFEGQYQMDNMEAMGNADFQFDETPGKVYRC